MVLTYVCAYVMVEISKKKKKSLYYRDFQVHLGDCPTTKPVITVHYEDVNHTEMQRWRGGHSIHGNHGDKVLGCTLSPLSGALVNQ